MHDRLDKQISMATISAASKLAMLFAVGVGQGRQHEAERWRSTSRAGVLVEIEAG